MSLCDSCKAPGQCCRNFHLPVRGDADDVDLQLRELVSGTVNGVPMRMGCGPEAYADALARDDVANVRIGLPYKRLYLRPDGWRFYCPLVDRHGRCTDYENRPATCRTFEPGKDKPCAHAVPGIGVCPERKTGPEIHYSRYYARAREAMSPVHSPPLKVYGDDAKPKDLAA